MQEKIKKISDIDLTYDNFYKALKNLKEYKDEKEPYSIIIQIGTVGLFEIYFKIDENWI